MDISTDVNRLEEFENRVGSGDFSFNNLEGHVQYFILRVYHFYNKIFKEA